MQVIEQFTQGKTGDDSLNEDNIIVTEDFIAVLDVATSRRGLTLRGMGNGRFAAQVVGAEIAALPPEIEARAAVDHLSEMLMREASAAAEAEGRPFAHTWDYPATALLVYSRARKEIWRVADSTFIVDGEPPHYRFFAQERTWCDLRRAWLQAQLSKGLSVEQLLENDGSWELLSPLIGELKIFANNDGVHSAPYGYGVINGHRVPDRCVEVYRAPDAKEIVFASDGYPEVLATLPLTEKALLDVVAQDPLMYRLQPQVKGVRKGWVSFDDRSYIRFSV